MYACIGRKRGRDESKAVMSERETSRVTRGDVIHSGTLLFKSGGRSSATMGGDDRIFGLYGIAEKREREREGDTHVIPTYIFSTLYII